MFVVEATQDGRDHRVIDRDADVYLKWLVAGGPYFTEVFSLVHAGESIPFTTVREEGVDAESALPYFAFRFLTFGSAPKAHRNTKHLVNRTFDDETERLRWMKVAAEALLVFGWAYNGLKAPHPSYTRVYLDGNIYTLKTSATPSTPNSVTAAQSFASFRAVSAFRSQTHADIPQTA